MFFTWKKPAHALREEGGVLCTLLLFQGIIMQLFALWELRWMQILQLRNGFHHTGRCWINLSQALLFFQQISTAHSLSCASLLCFQDSNSQIFPRFSVLPHLHNPAMLRTCLHFPSATANSWQSKSTTFLQSPIQILPLWVTDSAVERLDRKRRCCSTKVGFFQQAQHCCSFSWRISITDCAFSPFS